MGLPALLQFEDYEIRVLDLNGEPWWVLADVCGALGIVDAADAARRLDEDEKGMGSTPTLGGPQEMLIISEPGLYKLVGKSRKAVARRFDRWVRHEVLPTIRKTGSYGSDVPAVAKMIIEGFAEAIRPLGIRFDGQDRAIERIEARQEAQAEDIASIKMRLLRGRRKIQESTKNEHVDAIHRLGGRCPCGCGRVVVNGDGTRNAFTEFDHFYENSKPDADHSWLLHKICHRELSRGLVPRHEREVAFHAYQDARKRLPGRQIALFGTSRHG